MVMTSRPYVRCVSVVDTAWLIEMVPDYARRSKYLSASWRHVHVRSIDDVCCFQDRKLGRKWRSHLHGDVASKLHDTDATHAISIKYYSRFVT